MSPIGSFCTAIISDLNEFFSTPHELGDEDCSQKTSRMFPSSSNVSRERLALGKFTRERIGLKRKAIPYSETYYIDPERAICLLIEF
jgi:hypothetical protein